MNHGMDLDQLRARDTLRHGRLLKSSNGVVDFFHVYGTTFPPVGLTPAAIFSGSVAAPAMVVHTQVDCRLSSNLSILYIHQHLPQSPVLAQGATLEPVPVRTISVLTTSSMERCSNQRSGYITKFEQAVDGVFGFGFQDISVISQLSAQGVPPRVFSHCLRGDITGGGTLVLGEIVEPGIFYTPFVPSEGTIIDSRKTLAYLAEEAYDPFVNAITAAMPKSVHTFLFVGNQCFLTTNSITDFFPQVNLNFAGGASLDLRPQDYLIQPIDGGSVWCIGFQKIKSQRVTILGDLLLKDKIVVYDLDGQRIGWDDYDCSLPDNVCTAIGTSKHVNTGKTSGSTCLHDGLITSFFVTLILCFVYF
ncbi:hypothetical protein P8452_16747 [Trifolium repens]|nr:hypothetical protein P8452_16747 [Trifolium repens]